VTPSRKTLWNVAISVSAALVLTVVVNYLGAKYYTQWDWTGSGIYSLSGRTRSVVESLDRDVRFVSFLDPQRSPVGFDAVEQIEETLEAYRALSPSRVTIERLDPYREPVRAAALFTEFEIDPLDPTDIVVVEAGTRRKQVRLEEMVEYDLAAGMGESAPVGSLTAESALTAAILSVTRDEKPLVAIATGHGERAARGVDGPGLGRFVEALEREDTDVRVWDARGGEPIPEGTNAVIVAAPTEPWQEAAREALSAHLEAGGRALLFVDPVPQRAAGGELVPTGLEPLLARWGITLEQDVVLDPSGSFLGSAAAFLVEIGGGHPATDGLAGLGAVLQVARSLRISTGSQSDALVQVMLESSPASWGETDLETLFDGRYVRDDADLAGPLPLIVVASRPGANEDSQEPADEGKETGESETGAAQAERPALIVGGDVDLATNALFDNPGNRGLALNIVSWLVDEEEGALGIPPKDRKLSRLLLRRDELITLFPVVVLLPPLLAVALGVGLWMRRRRS